MTKPLLLHHPVRIRKELLTCLGTCSEWVWWPSQQPSFSYPFTLLLSGLSLPSLPALRLLELLLGGNATSANLISTQGPATVVASSYQAVANAINASVNNPARFRQMPLTLNQAGVSDTNTGRQTLRDHQRRVTSFVQWASFHANDYSAVSAQSGFMPTSVSVNGSRATVAGTEDFYLDLTIRDDGQPKDFSPEKAASLAEARREGAVIAVGQTNHCVISFRHLVTLTKGQNGWKIDTDVYVDDTPSAGDAFSFTTGRQNGGSQELDSSAIGVPFTTGKEGETGFFASPGSQIQARLLHANVNRSGAYQYADRWWNDRNLRYGLYLEDCTNFISQCLYDGNGGRRPGTNDWRPFSVAFINTDTCYNYMRRTAAARANDGNNDYGRAYYWQKKYMIRGDLVFYDWDGNGTKDHAAIGVAYDGNGDLLVDAHTNDRYHVPWDLWRSGPAPTYYMLDLRW